MILNCIFQVPSLPTCGFLASFRSEDWNSKSGTTDIMLRGYSYACALSSCRPIVEAVLKRAIHLTVGLFQKPSAFQMVDVNQQICLNQP